MHFDHARQVRDEQNGIGYEQLAMTKQHDANAEIAMQYLIWALEFMEKAGNRNAAKHARIALAALRHGVTPSGEKTGDPAGPSKG